MASKYILFILWDSFVKQNVWSENILVGNSLGFSFFLSFFQTAFSRHCVTSSVLTMIYFYSADVCRISQRLLYCCAEKTKKPGNETLFWTSYIPISTQSHYREVPRWGIFMEQELRFGLDFGQMANFPAFIVFKIFWPMKPPYT